MQYGGSEAHSTFFQRQRGDWEAATQGRDLMTSIRRFYSNAYTDSEKQAAINLFLGNFGERGCESDSLQTGAAEAHHKCVNSQ